MQPRKFILRDEKVRDSLLALVRNLPIDPLRPVEVVAREEVKARKPDQQALMFAGPLRDISEQAWFEGRQYSVEVLHEYCKRHFLPEEFDPEQCLEGYVKWDIDPSGERILVGSTKQLTVKGYSNYLEQVFAFGAALGVQFSAKGQ
jgi:hypothetical protein